MAGWSTLMAMVFIVHIWAYFYQKYVYPIRSSGASLTRYLVFQRLYARNSTKHESEDGHFGQGISKSHLAVHLLWIVGRHVADHCVLVNGCYVERSRNSRPLRGFLCVTDWWTYGHNYLTYLTLHRQGHSISRCCRRVESRCRRNLVRYRDRHSAQLRTHFIFEYRYMRIFISTWALLAAGLLFALPMILMRVKPYEDPDTETHDVHR